MRFKLICIVWFALWFSSVVVPAVGQETPEPPATLTYGKTPDTVIPYRHFHEPYNRFFQSATEFLGTGRDKTPSALPETVRIGFMVPTGEAPDADLGQEMLDAATLAIEETNAAGGYNGVPFELIFRPDSGLWGATSNEMVAFKYEDRVWAVIGSIDGANTHIALRVALKTQMPMVNTASTDPTLTETRIPWLLRCMADDRQQGYGLAYHIFHRLRIENVVALRVNDRYGRMGIAEFRDAARRLKAPLMAELRWPPGARNLTAQLDRIQRLDPEAIVLWGNAADAAAAVRAIRGRDMPVQIFGCDRLADPRFLAAAGDAAEGVAAVATFDASRADPELAAFYDAFSGRFGYRPGAFGAHTYDGTNILVETIRSAGLNHALIRDALHEYRAYEGVTGSIEFDTTLNDVGPVYIATVRDGQFVYERVDFTDWSQASAADRGARPAGGAPRHAGAASAVESDGASQIPYRTIAEAAPEARSPERGSRPQQPLYVGCFLPLDERGQDAVRGVQMAFAEDRARDPSAAAVGLIIGDARGAWGDDSSGLVDLVFEEEVLAIIGSTERRGTHLAEMLAAKMHFPVLSLCGSDPTITQIPLPWVFVVGDSPARVDPAFVRRFAVQFGRAPTEDAVAGYDAASLVLAQIRAGATTRMALRNALAGGGPYRGAGGIIRFDALGNRMGTQAVAAGAGANP